MNIYYFNITYTCNSNCVFCYSHNTIHSGHIFNEIEPDDFIEFLKSQRVQDSDRVIINGGEPFLHSKILEILKSLLNFRCEVLIYTNGRCLNGLDFGFMTNKYRFVIPVHGYKKLHDKITRCQGSFEEMIGGIKHLAKFKCKTDIKIILNAQMMSSVEEFKKTIITLDSLGIINALHVTKMADTIVSRRNGIPSVLNDDASYYTQLLYEHFKSKDIILKFFDTCIKDIEIEDYRANEIPLRVCCKDTNSLWQLDLCTPIIPCRKDCTKSIFCESAFGNYTVLEYNKGHFYKGIE